MTSTDPIVAPRRRSRLAAILLLLATFAVGLLAGVAIDRLALLRQRRIVPAPGRPVTQMMVRRLDRAIELTPQQEAEVRAILDRRMGNIHRAWAGVRPRVDAEVTAAWEEVEAVLDERQRAEFRKIRQRLERRSGDR